MCATCGCSSDAHPSVTNLQTGVTAPLGGVSPAVDGDLRDGHRHHHHPRHADHGHGHIHGHDHPHDHSHGHVHDHSHIHDSIGPSANGAGEERAASDGPGRLLRIEAEVLAKNNRLAEWNRGWFAGRNILALNLVSSPGAGKTALLERMLRDWQPDGAISVIEGDQATLSDAQRIRAAGAPVVQINTGSGCHLTADMLARGLEQLDPPLNSLVMIENVGNLVCPALFDLGERAKVVIASVTEGEDKPLKYPHMFRAGSVVLLNKVDLLGHVAFDVERFLDYTRQVNPHLQVFQVSATVGDGLEAWYAWVRKLQPVVKTPSCTAPSFGGEPFASPS